MIPQFTLRFGWIVLAATWGCEGQAEGPTKPRTVATAGATAGADTTGTSGRPDVVPAGWNAATPARDWKFLVLHHSATASGSVESIDAEHRTRTDSQGNPWKGIGYHFVIGNGRGLADGEVEPTFRWREQSAGAHAGDAEHNEHGIGICLIGNFEEAPPTARQLEALQRLVGYLKGEYGLRTEQVLKHGDFKATACPGRYFPAEKMAQTQPWDRRRPAILQSDPR